MKTKHLLHSLMAAGILSLSALTAQAIPAYPGKHVLKRADGTVLNYYLRGDEHHHWFEDESGQRIADPRGLERPENPGNLGKLGELGKLGKLGRLGKLEKPGKPGIAPLSQRGLVLLVEFSDVHFQPAYTQAVFQGLLNAEGYSQHGAQGSARDYFVSQSMGKYTPQFDVVGPIRLPEPMAYYGADDEYGTDAHAGVMVQQACQLAHDEHGVDFSQYDQDEDGRLDFVYLVYAGYGQNYGASANTVWPHTASLPDWGITLTLDGKLVNRYACGCELKYTQGTQLEGIGTFCHEFGHVLGLPDFYDTRHSNSMRLGVWDIMDQGCYNNESRTPCAYSAFERYCLGWLELTEPQDDVQLTELTQTNSAFRISTSRPDEYFILENRQQVGWDAYLPARGMLISHVDYDQAAWDANTVNNGTDQHYVIMAADGAVSSQNYGGDLFPSGGNDKFTDSSTPSMLMRDGTPTGKPIIKIRDVGGVITFRFMQQPLPRPEAPALSQVTATTLLAEWQPVEGAVAYRLQARQLLTAEENPVVADESFTAMTAGSAQQPDEAEMGTVLDSYLSEEGWSGTGLHQAGGRLSMTAGSTLQSPLLDLAEPEGRFTVALLAQAAEGTRLTIKAARNTGREISSTELTAEGGDTDALLMALLDGGIGRTRITIEVTQGQLLVSRLRIVRDHVAEADVWNEAAHTVTADQTASTSTTMTGLRPQSTYAVTLTALADDDDLNSAPSAEVIVTTAEATEAISDVLQPAAVGTQRYDLLGRPLGSNARPGQLVIERRTDGSVRKNVKMRNEK